MLLSKIMRESRKFLFHDLEKKEGGGWARNGKKEERRLGGTWNNFSPNPLASWYCFQHRYAWSGERENEKTEVDGEGGKETAWMARALIFELNYCELLIAEGTAFLFIPLSLYFSWFPNEGGEKFLNILKEYVQGVGEIWRFVGETDAVNS